MYFILGFYQKASCGWLIECTDLIHLDYDLSVVFDYLLYHHIYNCHIALDSFILYLLKILTQKYL
jgi:hypothetical protein